jgi:hypothetical protein
MRFHSFFARHAAAFAIDAIRHAMSAIIISPLMPPLHFAAFSATAPFRRHCQPLADSHAISPPFHF